jgi:hypothetical protein
VVALNRVRSPATTEPLGAAGGRAYCGLLGVLSMSRRAGAFDLTAPFACGTNSCSACRSAPLSPRIASRTG